MNWMVRWAGRFPIFVTGGKGAHFTDVDGHMYLDLCLGDTGAMTGHAPDATVRAIAERASKGNTFMLPTEDALWVSAEMARRFGLPYWQFALTATDANRFVIRLARAITKRPLICVFNWCYHGTVDETFVTLRDGVPMPRPGNLGMPVNPALTTRVIEFNDIDALQSALAPGDVACVLAEPAMTNIGIVHPRPWVSRSIARDYKQNWHAAHHRRDAYDLLWGRGLYARTWAAARYAHHWQTPRGWRARGGVWRK